MPKAIASLFRKQPMSSRLTKLNAAFLICSSVFRTMKLIALFLILSRGSNVVSAAERDAAITENELVRRTQELYDAVVPGNQAPWKKYFADDSILPMKKDAPWIR